MKILKHFLTFIIALVALLATLFIFKETIGSAFGYFWMFVVVVIYLTIWACVPLAEGLERRGRVKIFERISQKYGLEHFSWKIRYINSYGQFNILKGSYKGKNIEIKDVHVEPKALQGITSQIPARGVALSYGSQKTLYSINGDEKWFPQKLNTFNQIFNAKYGYASEGQIVSFLDSL